MNYIDIRNKLESEDNLYYIAQAVHSDGLPFFALRDLVDVIQFGPDGLHPSPEDHEENMELHIERGEFDSIEDITFETALEVFKDSQAMYRLEQCNIPEFLALVETGTRESILELHRVAYAYADLYDGCDMEFKDLLEDAA